MLSNTILLTKITHSDKAKHHLIMGSHYNI